MRRGMLAIVLFGLFAVGCAGYVGAGPVGVGVYGGPSAYEYASPYPAYAAPYPAFAAPAPIYAAPVVRPWGFWSGWGYHPHAWHHHWR